MESAANGLTIIIRFFIAHPSLFWAIVLLTLLFTIYKIIARGYEPQHFDENDIYNN